MSVTVMVGLEYLVERRFSLLSSAGTVVEAWLLSEGGGDEGRVRSTEERRVPSAEPPPSPSPSAHTRSSTMDGSELRCSASWRAHSCWSSCSMRWCSRRSWWISPFTFFTATTARPRLSPIILISSSCSRVSLVDLLIGLPFSITLITNATRLRYVHTAAERTSQPLHVRSCVTSASSPARSCPASSNTVVHSFPALGLLAVSGGAPAPITATGDTSGS
mmetsp:Transcript_29180/g.73319  ORF Transcript_29180/g.73319 Transcript_29180/m.73319 type:complete len:219 (+) Transcript_29180:876-1532(+)